MAAMEEDKKEFYVRYYVGHKGKFGHEFLEFEFRPDGKLRYANNSNYKNDTMIRKEVFLSPSVMRECKRIITDSEIMKEDDSNWPEPDRVGRQELEIVLDNEHISFTTSKIGSLVDVQSSKDPEGLRIFYYLVQGGLVHPSACNATVGLLCWMYGHIEKSYMDKGNTDAAGSSSRKIYAYTSKAAMKITPTGYVKASKFQNSPANRRRVGIDRNRTRD